MKLECWMPLGSPVISKKSLLPVSLSLCLAISTRGLFIFCHNINSNFSSNFAIFEVTAKHIMSYILSISRMKAVLHAYFSTNTSKKNHLLFHGKATSFRPTHISDLPRMHLDSQPGFLHLGTFSVLFTNINWLVIKLCKPAKFNQLLRNVPDNRLSESPKMVIKGEQRIIIKLSAFHD